MIGWLDCGAGASGDMFLGALVDVGVPLDVLSAAVNALGTERIELRATDVTRHGLAATKVDVIAPQSHHHRRWPDIRAMLAAADLAEPVRTLATDVFDRLAAAEATVHKVAVDEVHFHEVGALDAIADIVGAAAGLAYLGLDHVTAGTVTLGGGRTRGAHGGIPVPAPAVLRILAAAGAAVTGGHAAYEMCTPTGAALLAAVAGDWGPMPPMTVRAIGTGAGGRDPEEVPNLLRLVIGTPAEGTPTETELVIEANVDDLDPRLWPDVLDTLLAAGASDAWLTPIIMKKGRPAQTVHVLCPPHVQPVAQQVLFAHTSTIGVRSHPVEKHPLARRSETITVLGQPIRIKVAEFDGEISNTSVEYEDVRRAAAELSRPIRDVLAAAEAAASRHVARPGGD